MTASMGLLEAIDDALLQTNNGPTRMVVRYLQMNHRAVLDENSLTIESSGLGPLIRGRRKKPDPQQQVVKNKSLCLDFGLDYLDLDDEIAVPSNMDNLLSSPCEWPLLEEATITDLDKHLLLRDAQQAAHAARTLAIRTLRQAAFKVAQGQVDLSIRELRKISREQRGL